METITEDSWRRSLVDVAVGKNVKIFNFVNAYGCTIGDDTKIGSCVEIQKNAIIGMNCKISSHTFICEGVTIEDDVFIGHHVCFINDKYPRATSSQGVLQTDKDWNVVPIIVKKGASIGSGALIMCGVTIGQNALVGAGAIITSDVPDSSVVFGIPGRVKSDARFFEGKK